MSKPTLSFSKSFWNDVLRNKTGKLDDDEKNHLVFSLLQYLRVTTLDFLEFIFTSDIIDVKRKAGTFMGYDARKLDETRRFAPAVIFKAWHNKYPSSRPLLHDMIQPCAREIALQESDNIIKNKDLKLKTASLTQTTFEDILTPGKMVDLYMKDAPFVWGLLNVFASSPNPYRKRKAREKKKRAEEARDAATVVSEDDLQADEDDLDEDDSGDEGEEDLVSESGDSLPEKEASLEDDFSAAFLGGKEKPPGFSRNPLHVSRMVSLLDRQQDNNRPLKAILLSVSMMTFARNRATNALPMLMGLFFKVEGTSTRGMQMLSNGAMCVSARTADRMKESASQRAIEYAVSLIQSGNLFLIVADNINLYLRKYQQRLTNRNTMIHATNCAIVGINSEGIDVDAALDLGATLDLRGARKDATFQDITPSHDDGVKIQAGFESLIARLLAESAPGCEQWPDRKELLEKLKKDIPKEEPIPVEKTDTRPFGVFDVNEGSKKGIIDLLTAIQERSGLSQEEWAEHVRILSGDWLTSNNYRNARRERADDVSPFHRLEYVKEISQLFHFALNYTELLIRTHYGNVVEDPTSLASHKSFLRRVWDVNTANYAAVKSLVRHSLIARLLHIVMVDNGWNSHSDLAKNWRPTYDDLKATSAKIFKGWANTRAAEQAKEAKDDWTAHEVYFIRDVLLFLYFEEAVRTADPPRIYRCLRYWCLMFRGAGQHNYARECAEILLVAKYELTKDLKRTLERSWFINRWGLEDHWIATDLYLEQLNLLRVFIATGNGVTIEYIISKGSACVEFLRKVSHIIATFFGDPDRRRKNKEISFQEDMRVLIEEMEKKGIHKGYSEHHGVSAIVDVMVTGAGIWINKFEEFKGLTTFDPAVGYPIGEETADPVDVRLNNGIVFDNTGQSHLAHDNDKDLGIQAEGEIGGVGGADDYDRGEAE
ncbi:hypothetical protein NMY22_g4401 [Coprinellus aureogranulatus]|nr:hypothetical protein NMY22_g4401 [Coprinellus aureogranulatus]